MHRPISLAFDRSHRCLIAKYLQFPWNFCGEKDILDQDFPVNIDSSERGENTFWRIGNCFFRIGRNSKEKSDNSITFKYWLYARSRTAYFYLEDDGYTTVDSALWYHHYQTPLVLSNSTVWTMFFIRFKLRDDLQISFINFKLEFLLWKHFIAHLNLPRNDSKSNKNSHVTRTHHAQSKRGKLMKRANA